MKLNNLSKDMLVQLVSNLQDRKEKEYSHYLAIYTGVSDNGPVYHFNNERDLKAWILMKLLNYPKDTYNVENIKLFWEEIRKLLRNHYGMYSNSDLIEYCKNKSQYFQLDELLALYKSNCDGFVIIKGKLLINNSNQMQSFNVL